MEADHQDDKPSLWNTYKRCAKAGTIEEHPTRFNFAIDYAFKRETDKVLYNLNPA